MDDAEAGQGMFSNPADRQPFSQEVLGLGAVNAALVLVPVGSVVLDHNLVSGQCDENVYLPGTMAGE